MNPTSNPTSSFLGKCVTVFIGMVLSWATMTNPQIETLARHFLGRAVSQQAARSGDETFVEPSLDPAVEPNANPSPTMPNFAIQQQPHTVTRSSLSAEPTAAERTPSDRIELASQTLRELGATYLRLEKLSKPDGECFRVRCDLAGETAVRCCYEATRDTAVEAMEDVLRAVREGVASDSAKVASSR